MCDVVAEVDAEDVEPVEGQQREEEERAQP